MRALCGDGEAVVTLVVLDGDDVWHVVYNGKEVKTIRARDGYVENWQVRTRCSPYEEPVCLQAGVQRATIDDSERAGHTPTCVRCLAEPCDHGVSFDLAYVQRHNLSASEVRKRYPRLDGKCPKGCGYRGIAYDSQEHYVYGDW